MTVGERLRAERKRLGFTLEEFAKLGEVGRTTQIGYEKDATPPTTEYLGRTARLGLDTQYVVSGHRSVNSTTLYQAPTDALVAVVELQDEYGAFTADQLKTLVEFAFRYQADQDALRDFIQAAHRFAGALAPAVGVGKGKAG